MGSRKGSSDEDQGAPDSWELEDLDDSMRRLMVSSSKASENQCDVRSETSAGPTAVASFSAEKEAGGKFVLAVAWSRDGSHLACSTMDGTIAIFDVTRGKFLYNLEGHYMPVRSLVFSPTDSRILFSASDDKHIHMYDVDNKSLICAMSGHASWVLSIDVSPDGLAVATGSSDRSVRLWDLSMRASVQTMTNHTDQVWGVAFHPTGSSGSRSGRLAEFSDEEYFLNGQVR